MRNWRIATITTLALALTLTACNEDPVGPNATLLQCNVTEPLATSATIGPEGGALFIGAHSLVLPPGAVQGQVAFTATVVPDQYLKVRIQANGEESWRFNLPAVLSLNFGSCEVSGSPDRIRIYKVDPNKDRLISDHGGNVVTGTQSVVTTLDGLSTYTLGLPD